MNKEALGILIITVLLVIPGVSAELFMSQPQSLYNAGDQFNISITISPVVDSNSFLSVKMVCSSGELELYKSAKSVKAGKQETVDININLDASLIGSLDGECHVTALYGSDQANSQKFNILKDIKVNIELDKAVVNPGESVRISGDAKKSNGEDVNGFSELSVTGMNATLTNSVSNGKFAFNLLTAKNAPSGNYNVEVRVYEKDSAGNVINEGKAAGSFKVKQVIEKADVILSASSISPGSEASYKVALYDQANKETSEDVIVIVYDANKNIVIKRVIKSGVQSSILTASNSTPGFWKIEAGYNEITASGLFSIDEVMSASFRVENGTLIVTNTGNVPYTKPIEVTIGDKLDVVKMNLGVGRIDKIKLSSPGVNGTYNVKISDGNNTQDLGDQYFAGTGFAVFDDLSSGSFWVWVVIIIILVVIAVYYYKKIRKKSYHGKTPITTGPIKIATSKDADKASIIDKGEKQNSAIVALKIKNIDQIEKSNTNAIESINKTLQVAKEAKAKIYADGAYRLIIFAPIITKIIDNNLTAVKTANEIKKLLDEHNRKFTQKIDFGIGAHVGELAVERKDGQFRFSSLGNTIPIVKRTAESSIGEVYMTSQIHGKLLGAIKSEKVGESNFWQVKNIPDRDKHSGFIAGFLKRQSSEKQ